MNGLERTMAIVSGNSTDRSPYVLLLSLYGAKYINTSFEKYYRNPEVWFEGQKVTIDKFDPDIITSPFAFPLEAEAFGSQVTFPENYAPNIKKPLIKELSEISNLKLPDLNHPSLKFLIDTVELLVSNYKGDKAIAALFFSPCDFPALLLGIEKWVDTLLFHPESVKALMHITIPHFVRMANLSLEKGATFVVTTANFINPDIVTDKIFKEIKPFLIKAFEQIKGPLVIHHGGCRMGKFAKYYAELPNVIGLVIDPRDGLLETRTLINKQTVILGNLDGPGIEKLDKDVLRKKCDTILHFMQYDPHFIFATSNADIGINTPEHKLDTIIKIIRQFRLKNKDFDKK